MIQLTLTLKMTTAQVVKTSVTVNNSPIQDYVHPDDQTRPTLKKELYSIIEENWVRIHLKYSRPQLFKRWIVMINNNNNNNNNNLLLLVIITIHLLNNRLQLFKRWIVMINNNNNNNNNNLLLLVIITIHLLNNRLQWLLFKRWIALFTGKSQSRG